MSKERMHATLRRWNGPESVKDAIVRLIVASRKNATGVANALPRGSTMDYTEEVLAVGALLVEIDAVIGRSKTYSEIK